MDRNTSTPTTDNAMLMLALVASGPMGEVTVRILAQMYPDPNSMTN
jgi:hypothetical protein